MEVLFKCLQNGERYYGVRLNGNELFIGTRDECRRYISIHNRKVTEEHVEHSRTPRSRPVPVRTYRAIRAPA